MTVCEQQACEDRGASMTVNNRPVKTEELQ